jgi:hypothetical protein
VPNATRKAATRPKASSARKPSVTGPRSPKPSEAPEDLSLRNVVERSKETVARTKEVIGRSVGELGRELEKRRRVKLPIIDATVTLPPPDRATFYAGVPYDMLDDGE